MYIINPVCIARFLWRSVRRGVWVSGHDYETIKEKTPDNIHIIECAVCGHQSIGWSWNSLEADK